MRIYYNGFFNTPHSWSFVAQNMTRQFIELGHECGIKNTGPGGGDNIPEFFRDNLRKRFQMSDLLWAYTIPPNWSKRLLQNTKFKIGMYAYEASLLPTKGSWPKDWGQMYSAVDKIAVPSRYVKEIFINSGTPEERIGIVPHGVDTNVFNPGVKPCPLNTNKSFKFLAVATNQWRKNLHKLIEVYCNTFTKKDDVCLILKSKKMGDKPQQYDCDLDKELMKYLHNPNCPEIIFEYGYMKDTSSLYTACDCYINVSASEGFGLPLLEAQASNLLCIAPRYGGLLDFMNDDNSILVDCREICADPRYQYWGYNPKSVVCQPRWEEVADAMKSVYNKSPSAYAGKVERALEDAQKLSWRSAAEKMLGYVK